MYAIAAVLVAVDARCLMEVEVEVEVEMEEEEFKKMLVHLLT